MLNKVLKSYTIIPPHLYVRRAADRLLEFVINDTGRPGYVLVARQMGKTNLLLNAKNTLIPHKDTCVYIDFSNSFRNARECFRHIIDLTIRTNPEKLSFLSKSIKESRTNNDEVDHAEHEAELISILQVLQGKLIIFIDEVDAITTVPFSDTIFKQIRSVYFSRTNFPILHNLTYVLSGVGEPSTLIKDPKISPFNIGQEILLGDFSYSEYQTFITNSNLFLDTEVEERIYYWTSGNPRMTYEICSAVEDIILLEEPINIEIVDSLVHNMYLSTYDRVPLDNIRNLIESDFEILNSVKNIKENNSDLVTAAQRRKLYLAGIVGADYTKKDLVLKNRIIDQAISVDWLTEISSSDDIMQIATDAIAKGDYDGVVDNIEKHIHKYQEDTDFVFLQQLVINNYYKNNRYNSIIEHFEKYGTNSSAQYQKKFKNLKSDSLYFYALSLIRTSSQEKATEILKQIINLNSKNSSYFNSIFVLANLTDTNENDDTIKLTVSIRLDLYTKAVTELEAGDISVVKDDLNHIKTVAYYNLGMLYKDLDKDDLAFANFNEARKYAMETHIPAILYYMGLTCHDEKIRISLLEECIKSITDFKIIPRFYVDSVPLLINYEITLDLLKKALLFNPELALSLVRYIYDEEARLPVVLPDDTSQSIAPYQTIQKAESIARDYFFLISFEHFSDFLTQDQRKFSYGIFKLSNNISTLEGRHYIVALADHKLSISLDHTDAAYISIHIQSAINNGEVNFASNAIKYLRENYFKAQGNSRSEMLLVDYYEMEVMSKNSNSFKVFDKAKSILSKLKGFNTESIDSPFLNKGNIDNIRDSAFKKYSELMHLHKGGKSDNLPDRSRIVTVMYNNGKVETDKFKRFEKSIRKGQCRIINIS